MQTTIENHPLVIGKMAISTPELAKVLGVCEKTAYDLANSKGFPSFRLGRRILIPTDALREWLNKQVM